MSTALFLAVILQACDAGGGGGQDAGPTWRDPQTGYEWQREPSGPLAWQAASDYCGSLVVAGKTGWKLPTVGELRSIIRFCSSTQTGGSCTVTDSCLSSACLNSFCTGCPYGPVPYTGCFWNENLSGSCRNWYWSSSAVADDITRAWYVGYSTALVSGYANTYSANVRCVIDGTAPPPNDAGSDGSM